MFVHVSVNIQSTFSTFEFLNRTVEIFFICQTGVAPEMNPNNMASLLTFVIPDENNNILGVDTSELRFGGVRNSSSSWKLVIINKWPPLSRILFWFWWIEC